LLPNDIKMRNEPNNLMQRTRTSRAADAERSVTKETKHSMALPIDLWLIHPDVAMCDAFRARFVGLPLSGTVSELLAIFSHFVSEFEPLFENHGLGQQRLDDVAMHVGQSIISPLKSIGQLGMVKAEQMHPSRLQIVNVDRILRNRET